MFESQESIKKRAAKAIESVTTGDNFLKKYEKVKPVLDQYANNNFYEKAREKMEKRKAEEKAKIDEIRKQLGIAHLSPEDVLAIQRGEKEYTPPPVESSGIPDSSSGITTPETRPQSGRANILEIEQNMFSQGKMRERAQNRINVMKGSKDYDPAKTPWTERAKNILKKLDNWKGFGN